MSLCKTELYYFHIFTSLQNTSSKSSKMAPMKMAQIPNKAANSLALHNSDKTALILHVNILLNMMRISHVSAVISTPAPGPVGCWEPWMFAPAGEGTHPAVSPLPVPASARELQAALWVRQPAGGSQLWPQHGDLCRAEEQLGRPLLLWHFTFLSRECWCCKILQRKFHH